MKKFIIIIISVLFVVLKTGIDVPAQNTQKNADDPGPGPSYTIEKVVYEIRVCEPLISAMRLYYKNPDATYTWVDVPEGLTLWVKIFEEWPDKYVIPHLVLFGAAPQYSQREGYIAWKRSDFSYFELSHQPCLHAPWQLWADWPL